MLTAVILFAAQSSCGLVVSDPSAESGGASSSGSGGTGGHVPALGGNTGGGIFISTGGTAGDCAVDNTLLAAQTVSQYGSPRVFYSWTTDDQVAELRAGGPLFSRSESPGQGRGLAFTELATYAASGTGPEQTLAGQLESVVFAKARFAWPNPWATLLGWPGESYGTQLLQIELKPEAWVAVFSARRGLQVLDAQNQPVDINQALANPQRIGAIYYESTADSTTNYCGTFSYGAVAFREFILGNIQMVQSWSLATPEIAQRLGDDVALLEKFESMLSCLAVPAQAAWSSMIGCGWSSGFSPGYSLLDDYDFSLGIPSQLYWPSTDNIQALIAALQASMPTGAPLVVTPNG